MVWAIGVVGLKGLTDEYNNKSNRLKSQTALINATEIQSICQTPSVLCKLTFKLGVSSRVVRDWEGGRMDMKGRIR